MVRGTRAALLCLGAALGGACGTLGRVDGTDGGAPAATDAGSPQDSGAADGGIGAGRNDAGAGPSFDGGLPTLPATLKNGAGVNVEPGMRPWRYNGPQPDSWWCTDGVDCLVDPANPNAYQSAGVLTMIDREFQLAADLNVATLRIEFDWPLIETARGAYDWARADSIVAEAARYGIQLQPVLVYTPLWASSQPSSNMWYGVSPASVADWTDFVTQVVSRYKGSVHYWEIWNEPDGGGYWYSSQSAGVQDWVTHLLNPGYAAIKAADSTAQVMIGPDHADTAWYDLVVSSGGGASFDILAFHSYTNAAISEVQTMQAWLNGKGMGAKPIWIGEYGIAESTNTPQDTLHQSLLQQVLGGSGYQQAQWYTLRDELPRSCCPVSGAEARYFGVVQHDDATTKDGYATMKSLIH